ncbi:Cobalt transport system, permease component [Nostocoides australiense Ben110]|uniref:Cobalt transport system, permease component n=1 Tax=Nostocoides australiense Ben110 TaxID=1193182 RepID=W6K3J6_9MICO|nr:CbiQ family ECF transporter T component [Tetrasphaera australiensis]CCH73379.1 Cobalt transport system, permease component [Tetrasphaera australiensis Ben110]
MIRHLHPAAWWLWALALAASASMTTNPVLLAAHVGVLVAVVLARRDGSPWGRAFRLYAVLGVVIVLVRLVLHALVGLKFGDIPLLPLPETHLPSWAAGIQLGGTVYLEGALGAGLEGARLATMILAIGAANALASPKRLLKVFPAALHEIGAALVVAVTVAPQLAESVQRVARARQLRGEPALRLKGFRRIAMPVLQDTLDRSLALAAAMDGRGYGRRPESTNGRATGVLTLLGLLGSCVGIYGLLDTTSPAALGMPTLVVGLLLCVAGLWSGGRSVPRTIYRRDPWGAPEWLTIACGAAALVAMLVTVRRDPAALGMPLAPLGLPALPVLPLAGLALAAVPAVATPVPPLVSARRAPREVAA